jgi:hypothetical protein
LTILYARFTASTHRPNDILQGARDAMTRTRTRAMIESHLLYLHPDLSALQLGLWRRYIDRMSCHSPRSYSTERCPKAEKAGSPPVLGIFASTPTI